MLREATLLDFIAGIGISGALALTYLVALKRPGGSVGRALHAYHRWWERIGPTFSARGQIIVLAIVMSAIAILGVVLLVVQLSAGRLP
jgi:hypothetical protein